LLDGPVNATELLFKKTGMNMSNIDLVEINEAFAAVVLSWQRVFNADMSKVNVNGGAIALGHPVGMTGTRLVMTLLYEMKRRGAALGAVAMCVGGGQGAAMVLEQI